MTPQMKGSALNYTYRKTAVKERIYQWSYIIYESTYLVLFLQIAEVNSLSAINILIF